MGSSSWWLWGAIVLVVGCGARSSLDALGEERDGSSGAGGLGGSSPGVTSATSTGAGGSMTPDIPCTYELSGAPEVAISLPDRHATSPRVLTTNPDPSQGPLEVALQYIASGGNSPLHPENPITRVRLEPASATLTLGETVVAGIDSHSYGLFARSSDRMAMAWYTDAPGFAGVAVRTIGVSDNALGPIHEVESGSSSVSDLVAGATLNGGALGGEGYAVSWRRPGGGPTTRAFAVLDSEGAIASGPFDVTPTLDPPPSPALAWTGESYLIATAYGPECPPAEPLCTADSITILRFAPPAPGTEPIAAVVAIAPAGDAARRPRFVGHDGRTILLWEEWTADGKDLRFVELDPGGEPLAPPSTIEALEPDDRWGAHASDQGIAVAYLRGGDDDGPPDQPGAAFLHLLALAEDGTLLGEATPVPVTLPQGTSPSIAALGGEPRSLAIAWSGRGADGFDATYLARLRCVDAGP